MTPDGEICSQYSLMRYLLGIDIGTSSTKTVVLEEAGNVVAIGQQPYDFETPQPGWAEQAPEVWWQAAKRTIQQVLHETRLNPQEIAGVGLSGQMHGPVFLDRQGHSLRPAIIWADQRSVQECQEIYATVGKEGLFRTVCNPVDTGFMAATLLWIKRYEPDTYRRLHTVLLPKDYVRFRLTGEFATDPSDAGGTSLFDVRQRCWSDEIIQALQLAPSIFPTVTPSHTIAGAITRAAAAETGLAFGTPVVIGGSDQTMGALACGAIQSGPVLSVIGTGGTLLTTVNDVVVDPALRMHTYPHCVPDAWHLLGAILAGGLSLKWLRQILRQDDAYSYEAMTHEAATVPAGSEGAIFLPYLAGERTPHMDSLAKGVFFGLTIRHTRAHLIRAVMEGVLFALRDGLEVFRQLQVHPAYVIAGGGGAVSPLWRQMQADIFNLPVVTVALREQSATGAAMLAGIGTQVWPSFQEACQKIVVLSERTVPVPGQHARYAETYQNYVALYPILKERFHHANRL